jgi:hypothetical protein
MCGWLVGAMIFDDVFAKCGWYAEHMRRSFRRRTVIALLWPCVIATFAIKGLPYVHGGFLDLILNSFFTKGK